MTEFLLKYPENSPAAYIDAEADKCITNYEENGLNSEMFVQYFASYASIGRMRANFC